MEKTIKAILLTNNQILVSQIDEVGADIGQPDCKLTNPFTLQKDGTLEPWLISVSRQDVFMESKWIGQLTIWLTNICSYLINLTH